MEPETDAEKQRIKEEIKEKMQEANKTTKRKTPLFLSDPRFKTFLKTTSRHFRQKYAKLFRRTQDKNERNAADEMVITLAAFVFEELRMLYRVKDQTGVDSFILFNQYLFAMMDTWLPKEEVQGGKQGSEIRADGVRKEDGTPAQTEGQSVGEDVANGGSSEPADVPGEAANGRERTFGRNPEDAGESTSENEGDAETTNTEEAG